MGRFTHTLRGLGSWGRRLVPNALLSLVSLGKGGLPQLLKVTSAPPLRLTEGPLGPWVAANGRDSLGTVILGEGGRREAAAGAEAMGWGPRNCRIRNGENGIHFLLNRDGKRRGDALIEMESEQDVQKALEKHRMYMGQRYVEVYEINNEDVDALMKSLQVKSSPVVNDGVVRLRGLPYSCNEKDIVDFFAGLNIVDITFVMDYRGRRKTGEAYVQFEEPEMANQALLKHREEIGNRYIEIFPSRRNEVRTHVGSHKGKKMASSPTAKYITEPEMVFEEHEVNEDTRPMTGFESEKEVELPKETSEKLPEAVDFGAASSLHFVHMRGLPFHANAQDIINFFAPLKPVRITMEYSSSGKATGEADVHFDTHEDAVAAMLKDRSHVRFVTKRCLSIVLSKKPAYQF
ncbi:G-rich sequence factor 1 [Camelus ferus]|nr:G-rich sequence factor 1 [Camelus ferus]